MSDDATKLNGVPAPDQAQGHPVLQIVRMQDGSYQIDSVLQPPQIFSVIMDIMPTVWGASKQFAKDQHNKAGGIVKPSPSIIQRLRGAHK